MALSARRDNSGDATFPGLSDAQFGSIAEERLGTSTLIQAPGMASLAFPLVDLGFDFYLRRIRTLRVHPVQVKARNFLDVDQLFQVSVSSLHPDPNGYVVLPFVPSPDYQLAPKLWIIPIPQFLRLAKPHDRGYVFSAHLDPRSDEPATPFLVDADRLATQWFARIPGWKGTVQAPPIEAQDPYEQVSKRAARPFGKSGELWLGSQLMGRALDGVCIAQDRLRLDCVDLLLHDLTSFSLLGLALHACTITARGTVEARVRYSTYFVDDRLLTVLLVYRPDGSLHDLAFLVPSVEVVKGRLYNDRGDAGYVFNFRMDPLADRMRRYAVPAKDLADAILDRLRRPSR